MSTILDEFEDLIPGTVLPSRSVSVIATVLAYQCAFCGVQWFVGQSHQCPKITPIQSTQSITDAQSALEQQIRADEREACAKIAESLFPITDKLFQGSDGEDIAKMIRARGK